MVDFKFTDLYVYDKSSRTIHKIGDDKHDSLRVDYKDGKYEIRYYNMQNGCGGRCFEDGDYVILQSEDGLLTDEFGIIDKRYEKEIAEYIAQHAAERIKNDNIHNNGL